MKCQKHSATLRLPRVTLTSVIELSGILQKQCTYELLLKCCLRSLDFSLLTGKPFHKVTLLFNLVDDSIFGEEENDVLKKKFYVTLQ